MPIAVVNVGDLAVVKVESKEASVTDSETPLSRIITRHGQHEARGQALTCLRLLGANHVLMASRLGRCPGREIRYLVRSWRLWQCFDDGNQIRLVALLILLGPAMPVLELYWTTMSMEL